MNIKQIHTRHPGKSHELKSQVDIQILANFQKVCKAECKFMQSSCVTQERCCRVPFKEVQSE